MGAIGGLCMILSLISLAAVIKPFGPYKKRWHAFLGFLVLAIVGGALVPTPPATTTLPTTVATSDSSSGTTETASTSVEPAQPQSRWRYSRQHDDMRNANTDTACLESTNELRFDFPYQGGSTAEICFRQSPQYGFDAWVRIERGQFTCLMDCIVRVKFDDGEIQTFSAGGSSDGSADIVFVRNASRFLSGTRGASQIIVEADFYQAGARQMAFENAGGLVWPQP